MWVISFTPRLLYLWGKSPPSTHCIWAWMSPTAGLHDVEMRKFLILPGLQLRPLCHTACRQSLCRLSRFVSSPANNHSTITPIGIRFRHHRKQETDRNRQRSYSFMAVRCGFGFLYAVSLYLNVFLVYFLWIMSRRLQFLYYMYSACTIFVTVAFIMQLWK
jgi:hypothetical protein